MKINPPIFSEYANSPTVSNSCRISICVGCGGPIYDQFILKVAPNLEWHAGCLKCADCGQTLDETCTCFVKSGKIYCKKDYTKLYGAKCAKCNNGFDKKDFVMRAKNRIFHIECFRCVTCHRQLIPGDEFALHGNDLFCKADHVVMSSSELIVGNTGLRSIPPFSNPSAVSPARHSSNPIDGIRGNRPLIVHRNTGAAASGQKRKDSKPTRVRTVLNEKQLHTLRTCYAANCRPDALMKEQLTEMTGLSARVIRVWFQNKRCKDKKRSLAIKQMQEQAKQQKNGETGGDGSNLQRMNGVPMIVSEPVKNNPPNPKPVEVQNYQQPAWKALSEFAMQSEIEQPGFQNLVSNFSDHGQGSISDSSEICSIPSVSSAGIDVGAASTPLTIGLPEATSASACT